MCTVTYLPILNKGYLLTQNRDEKRIRGKAHLPSIHHNDGWAAIYPTDADALGTWIVLSHTYSCSLLNGGFTKHHPSPPYRHSRGQIILDLLSYTSISDFISQYNFTGLEPFTLVVVDHVNESLHELVWDNNKLYHQLKNPRQPHLWSSSTLYSSDDKIWRQGVFNRFVDDGDFTRSTAIAFHKLKHDEREGFLINRNEELKTVSLTSIVYDANEHSMRYEDLIDHEIIQLDL